MWLVFLEEQVQSHVQVQGVTILELLVASGVPRDSKNIVVEDVH